MAFSRRLMCFCNFLISREKSNIGYRLISTTSVSLGKRNFRKFPWIGRGTDEYKERKNNNEYPDVTYWQNYYGSYGKEPGYRDEKNNLVVIPEMIPELVVPDLTDCRLKPYVSYRAPDVAEPELTAQDLFDYVYGRKIRADFLAGKLDANGEPLEKSEEESLTPEEARLRAQKINSDMFLDEKNLLP